jgi:catalase
VHNLVDALGQCDRAIQERMVWHLLLCEDELGLRVGDGLNITPEDVRDLPPLQSQDLTDEDRRRLSNLGKNGPRPVDGRQMTHCVPNENVQV